MDSQRVKVYRLNEEGTWDDKGTGHVTVEYRSGGTALVVVGEADPRTLLVHRISKDNAYQRQGEDTIITWSDAEIGTDVALSFQEPNGCAHVWHHVVEAQEGGSPRGGGGLSPHASSPGSPGAPLLGSHRSGMIDEFDQVGAASPYGDLAPGGPGGGSHAPELPQPELSTLPAIARSLSEVSLFHRNDLAAQLLNRGYLQALASCFRTAEDLEDEASLAALYEIVKGAVLLNDPGLFEALFSDELVGDMVGALEHDPGVPPAQRPRHRQTLAQGEAFKEVVPIPDPAVRAKIRQSFRMGYVKDAVLPHTLDDGSFQTLSSLQLFNNMEVLTALHADPDFFPELFRRLKAAEAGTPAWRDLVAFLQELAGLARHMQAAQRNALLGRLAQLGLFQVLAEVLASGDGDARLRAADVLLADAAHDPGRLRAFLQGEGAPLFGRLVSLLVEPDAGGLQEQVAEVVRLLLDPDTMESSVEKDAFIDLFYDLHIGRLLGGVVAAGATPPAPSAPPPATLALLVDLLCFCVTQHSYRIKYYILRNNVVEKVLRLLRRREGAVAAAALRFLRTCLNMRDEFYNRYLVKNGLMEPVIAAFLANGARYNLLNSATLELWEFVRRENMKGLLAAVVDSPQWPRLLEEAPYADTLKMLQAKHEANLEGRPQGGGGAVGPMRPRPGSGSLEGGQQQQQGGGAPAPAEAARMQQQAEAGALAAQRTAAAAEAMRRRGEREEDADEENYFREDDDDDDEDGGEEMAAGPVGAAQDGQASARQLPALQLPVRALPGEGGVNGASPLRGMPDGRLVDYGDEDEDEGDTLPLRVLSRSANGTPKRGPISDSPASPPDDKRPRPASAPPG